jgi:hypothetical protein
VIPSPPPIETRRPGAFLDEEGSLDRTDGLPPTRERTRPPPDPGPRPTTGSSWHRASARKGRPRARRFGARPSAAPRSRATANAPRNRLGGPGPQLTSVDWDVSAPPRFGKAGIGQALGPDRTTAHRVGTCSASATQALQPALGPDGKATHAAPGSPTPLGGADRPRRGPRRRHDGASAPAQQTRTQGSDDGASAPPDPPRNLTAPPRRSSQEVFPGERRSPPRCTRSPFFGRTKPGDKTDQTGLAPDSPQRHREPT